VLVYRFLTAVPTLLLGLGAAFTIRRRTPPGAMTAETAPVESSEHLRMTP
jgi:hypothetical protein